MIPPPKPDWWPQNPYGDFHPRHHWGQKANAWQEASDVIFAAFCAQTDAVFNASLERLQQLLQATATPTPPHDAATDAYSVFRVNRDGKLEEIDL